MYSEVVRLAWDAEKLQRNVAFSSGQCQLAAARLVWSGTNANAVCRVNISEICQRLGLAWGGPVESRAGIHPCVSGTQWSVGVVTRCSCWVQVSERWGESNRRWVSVTAAASLFVGSARAAGRGFGYCSRHRAPHTTAASHARTRFFPPPFRRRPAALCLFSPAKPRPRCHTRRGAATAPRPLGARCDCEARLQRVATRGGGSKQIGKCACGWAPGSPGRDIIRRSRGRSVTWVDRPSRRVSIGDDLFDSEGKGTCWPNQLQWLAALGSLAARGTCRSQAQQWRPRGVQL
jgi:hypothetical protein